MRTAVYQGNRTPPAGVQSENSRGREPMNLPRKLLLASAAIAIATPMMQAQSKPAAPVFAVASIKPSKPDARGIVMQFLPGGRLVVTNYPLFMIVAAAYDLPFQSTRLVGGPAWIRCARYDIEATAEKGAPPPGLTG